MRIYWLVKGGLLLLVFALVGCSGGSGAKNNNPTPNVLMNPRDTAMERPDPYVFKDTDGYYYGLHTIKNGPYIPEIRLYKSKSLSNLFATANSKTIWKPAANAWNNKDVWAPELYKFDGTWYIYYSANWRVGVLSCTAADPMTGTWVDVGPVTSNNKIDGTILGQYNNRYMLYSQMSNGVQSIYIQKMKSPTELDSSSTPLQISKPDYDWEKMRGIDGPLVNEGPQILQKNGKTFCVFSASFCATEDYCLGMLSILSNADPMVKENWTKSPSPVFSKGNGLYGVGHCSFTKSPDGTQDWLIYHGCIIQSSTLYQNRYVCMQPFTWNSDGTPNFGTPQGRLSGIAYPSGE
ncbi:MAG TPA: glycoside hydrolase family 43 protein [Bacillota bacterium]|nr:glycoside hydrolase family 43 protein [Bacillota bacterium]